MLDRLHNFAMLAALLACVSFHADEGLMGSNRQRKAWGLDGRQKKTSEPVVKSKMGRPTNEALAAAEAQAKIDAIEDRKEARRIKAIQKRCYNDPKYLYQSVLAPQRFRDPISGRSFSQSLGKLHDFMFDFLTFQFTGVARYSTLGKHMPEKDERGNYKERWIYWPTLNAEPVIQDGANGTLSRMFHSGERIWRGLLIRIKGSARTKCVLMPRGHLKSTICNQTYILWRVARQPAIRCLIKSLNSPNARSFMDEMKSHFVSNPRFKRLFSHLGPPAKREDGSWNADFIKVYCDERIGKEPTVWAQGVEAEIASQHFDLILCDDVIAEKNTETSEQCRKGCERMQKLQGVRDPNTELVNLGTRWEDVDSHGMFVNKDSTLASNACFAVATVEDDNHQPIWPEKWSLDAIKEKRESIPMDRIYYGQYFNQFAGTSARNFKAEWIRQYHASPFSLKFLNKRSLNIFIGVDTASGVEVQKGKDFTAAVVLGQSEKTKRHYILDGLCERLRAEQIPVALVSLFDKWRRILERLDYGGTLTVGIEETAFTGGQNVSIDYEIRQRGIDDFHIVPLKHNKLSKQERVRSLATPYAAGEILWPSKQIMVTPTPRKGEAAGDPYDFIEVMRDQFVKYPGVTHDDIMDAKAMAYELTELPDLKGQKKPKPLKVKVGALPSRAQSLADAESQSQDLGGYDDETQSWGMV